MSNGSNSRMHEKASPPSHLPPATGVSRRKKKNKKKRQECSSGMIECPYQEIHELIRQLNVRCQSVIGPMGKSMRRDKIDPKYSICTRLYHHVPRPSIIVEHIGVVDLALFLKAA